MHDLHGWDWIPEYFDDEIEQENVLYFAYGSNLHPDRLADRGIYPQFAIRAKLEKHRLTFDKSGSADRRGRATVVRSKSDLVYGVVYTISAREARRLDAYEGVSSGHYRRQTINVIIDGSRTPVVTYIATNRDRRLIPTREYRNLVFVGARYHRFPRFYLRQIMRQQVA